MQQYADIYSLHTIASVRFLFTLNYDARNHELKKTSILDLPFHVLHPTHWKFSSSLSDGFTVPHVGLKFI